MRNSTCDVAQRSLVRRWGETDGVSGEVRCQRQVWIERRLRVFERHRSHEAWVVPEGVGELARELEAARTGARDMHDVWPLLAGQQRKERVGQVVDICRRVVGVAEAVDRARFTQLAVEKGQERGRGVIDRTHTHARESPGRGQRAGDLGTQLRASVDSARCNGRRLAVAAVCAGEDVVGRQVQHRHVRPGSQHVGGGADVGVIGEHRCLLARADVLVPCGMHDPAWRHRSRCIIEGTFVQELARQADRAVSADADDLDVPPQPLGESLPNVAIRTRQQKRIGHESGSSPPRPCTTWLTPLLQDVVLREPTGWPVRTRCFARKLCE